MRQAEKVDLGSDDWTMEIRPYASAFHFPIKELWEYRSAVSVCAERFQNDVQTDHFGPGVDTVKPAFDNGDVQSDLWQDRRNIHRWDACISVLYGRQYSVNHFFKLLAVSSTFYW